MLAQSDSQAETITNKTMRMHVRRFTRLMNGRSKKVANHAHMVALYTLFYNFIRTHGKLRMTPAMAAGIARPPSALKT